MELLKRIIILVRINFNYFLYYNKLLDDFIDKVKNSDTKI